MSEHDTTYDEKHVEVWRQGGLRPVKLEPLTFQAAMALRAKLYRLRKRLIKDKHEAANLAVLATIKFFPIDNGNFALMVHPSNMEYDQAFNRAGIKSDDPPDLD